MHPISAIKNRIDELINGETDFFGTYLDLVLFLPLEEAKHFFKKDITEAEIEEMKKELKPYTKEEVIAEIVHYLPFAYNKAREARGLSANRSISHFRNWLWLLKDVELLKFLDEEENYPMYGFPILQAIAKKYAPDLVQPYNNIEDRTGEPIF